MANLPLKICQVNPGCGIEIPPKGWGAIEKIVWEFTTNLRKQGHQVDIKWTDEIKKDDYDIVHVHVANLALILAKKGIPYIFQCHDHHAYHYGKDSFVFKQNLEAIENSELSILPAKYLVEYFGSNKAVYFSHGVDTDFFTPNVEKEPHKLLMVANNGLGGKDGYDRKGFTEGIQAAKVVGLPITIVGPENNKNFIKNNPWVKSHDVNWVFNPNQEELLKLYQEHTIFLHPSELEAGHPNLTILEAMACGLPVVGCMEDNLEGMIKVDKKVRSVYEGIKQVINNYESYLNNALSTSDNLSWYNRSKELVKLVKPNNMKEVLIKEYNNTKKRLTPLKSVNPLNLYPLIDFQFNFNNGVKCELKGNSSEKYKVEFIDSSTGDIPWSDIIGTNMWTTCSKKYFIPWKVVIRDSSNNIIHTEKFDCTGKKVYIKFDSKSIGDTLAWFPYVEEFRKKHNCELICSTFHNDWFNTSYPEIKFVTPGTYIDNTYASYEIGWYYFQDREKDMNKHPVDFLSQPLQKTASDILGLDFEEIKPKIKSLPLSPIKEKYATISIQSTCQAKYWNHPTGWKQVVKHLQKKGYKVAVVDQHRTFGAPGFMNTSPQADYHFHNKSLEEVMSVINGADLHIGIGSGLSWMAWALNIPTMLISSFSKPYCEFTDCTRIYVNTSTSGYFNTHKLSASDWNWYPFKKIKSIEDWYEIESITPDLVIENLDRIL